MSPRLALSSERMIRSPWVPGSSSSSRCSCRRFETIEGEGEVVRIVPGGPNSKSGMGVVFTSLSAYSKRLLTQLVTRRPGKA